MKTGIEIRPSFSLSQHRRNLDILKKIHGHFGCGAIRYSKSDHNYKYEVRSLTELRRKIIPHFEKFPLKTSKLNDFEGFKCVCDLMANKRHFTRNGMERIIHLASSINPSGKRKYSEEELLKILNKMKV